MQTLTSVTLRCFPYPLALALAAGCLLPGPAAAFNPPTDTQGPLTVSIAEPAPIRSVEEAISTPVTLTNSGTLPVSGRLRIAVAPPWTVPPPAEQAIQLPAHVSITVPVDVRPGSPTYAALYPVHAFVTFHVGNGPTRQAHAVLIVSVPPSAIVRRLPAMSALPTVAFPSQGRLSLLRANIFQPGFAVHDRAAQEQPVGWEGTDAATGTDVGIVTVSRGEVRRALTMHEPWREGWGQSWVDYRLKLPPQGPIHLRFATAIRDSLPTEPLSDGVEFEVFVNEGAGFQRVFDRVSAAKRWEPAVVDLSAAAGRTITLRLLDDPGPAHDTSCDQAYWANPAIVVGSHPAPEPAAHLQARRERAVLAARAAAAGRAAPWSWTLRGEAGAYGAAVIPGPAGLPDAILAFSDGRRDLTFNGFRVEVDGQSVGSGADDIMPVHQSDSFAGDQATFAAVVPVLSGSAPIQVRLWADGGALRLAFSMPGVHRDARGDPRFTALSLGPGSEKAHRVYAGFGNVLQDPGPFVLDAGGFTLSTRHVGADYPGGLSLVQASDVFPDSLQVDPTSRRCSLVAHLDATFTLAPSDHGAFSAARVYRAVAHFQPAGGVKKLQGRICLDQWGGSYRENALLLEQAARYGLTDAVYVQHVWQRWGYDYRLPDVYPPAGSFTDFLAMVNACKRNGILYSPHDNYIDFYPDATGYSYHDIVFNGDGTPQKAWFNEGRGAQSYRWLPTAFQPWMQRNLSLIKAGFAPTAYFVDVFSAMAPFDYYDDQGRFYPKTVTAQRWGEAFDTIRRTLGGAPTISEAGDDALVGHLDAGEADHAGWNPALPGGAFHWTMPAADGERVPWHDVASHGDFVLLGGGLGSRYAGGQDPELHGYASDDYLCTTAMGGRNPMAEGPFNRGAVMTDWLLHDVCAGLQHRELLDDTFAGDDIHRQVIRFSGGAQVHANRGVADWTVDGVTLPQYGFLARDGDRTAMVTRRQGVITGFARSPGVLFVDARPPQPAGPLPRVVGMDLPGGRRFLLRMTWTISAPVPPGYQPFLHFVDEKQNSGEGIVFQGSIPLEAAQMGRPGTYVVTASGELPENLPAGTQLAIRAGLWSSTLGGARLPLSGTVDSGGRARLGTLVVGDAPLLRYVPEPPDPVLAERLARLNTAGKIIDFGPVATSGAFRLMLTPTTGELRLIPLPGSSAFPVELRLDRLGLAGRRVVSVVTLPATGTHGAPLRFTQEGPAVHFETVKGAFGLLVRLAR